MAEETFAEAAAGMEDNTSEQKDQAEASADWFEHRPRAVSRMMTQTFKVTEPLTWRLEKVGDDGFRCPTDQVRRQQRANKKAMLSQR